MNNKLKAAFVATCLVMSSYACAQGAETIIPDDWSTGDTVRQTLVVASLAVDMGQTLQIKNHPNMYETNKVLGRHPSDVKIVGYFVGVALAHTYIAAKMPAGWPRQTAQYVVIACQVAQVIRNKRGGLNVGF